MSNLETENATLKKQVESLRTGIESLNAQLEAHKGMLNESLNASIQLRTNLVLLSKRLQESTAKNDSQKAAVVPPKPELIPSTPNPGAICRIQKGDRFKDLF